jgi:hypothetical protein
MCTYRLYFLASGRIRAAEEFEANNDIDAIRIARLVYDACSDMCEAFELWQATRLIRTRPPPYSGVSLSDLTENHQRIVIEREEVIRNSHWALARSQRLIEALDLLKLSRNPSPPR